MLKLNDIEITPTIFSDKTSQVWQLPENAFPKGLAQYEIKWEFESEAEIFHLCQLVKLIRHKNIPKPINLHVPYLPYGRQDKEVSNDTTFALTVFADIINSLKFDRVNTIDAHSRVAYELINNLEDNTLLRELRQVIENLNIDCIAYPDKGASKRYLFLDCYHDTEGVESIIGHKIRDQKTGYITKYEIEGNPKGKTILMVDDICDGGMTFRLMAKELLSQGAKEVNLYTTHGIFSKGVNVLLDDGVNRIFTREGEVFPHKLTTHLTKEHNTLLETELSNI